MSSLSKLIVVALFVLPISSLAQNSDCASMCPNSQPLTTACITCALTSGSNQLQKALFVQPHEVQTMQMPAAAVSSHFHAPVVKNVPLSSTEAIEQAQSSATDSHQNLFQ